MSHKCWDRVILPFVLLFFWSFGSCTLPCALANVQEVTLNMSLLLHSIFLSSGDLNNTPGIYQAYLSPVCLSSSSPIPLLSEANQGPCSNCTSLVSGSHTAFRSCLPQPSPIFFYPSGKGMLRLDRAVGEACAGRLYLPRELWSRGCLWGSRLCCW